MKKNQLLIIFSLLIQFCFSQESDNYRKASISPTAYYVSTIFLNGDYNKTSYESLSSNSTGEFSIDFNIPIKQKLEIKTGIGYNQRYGNAFILNIEDVRVNEYFIRFPLLLTYISPVNKTGIYVSIGPYADLLVSQKFYFKDNSTKPTNFNDKKGFGSYYKIGMIIRTGFRFSINEKSFIDCGLLTSTDYKGLFINSNDNPSYDYTAYGVYISLGIF